MLPVLELMRKVWKGISLKYCISNIIVCVLSFFDNKLYKIYMQLINKARDLYLYYICITREKNEIINNPSKKKILRNMCLEDKKSFK